jgi:hypothetical protein
VQPRPKLGRWAAELDGLLASNAAKAAREQLTLIRIFEELRGRGYDGGYDAVFDTSIVLDAGERGGPFHKHERGWGGRGRVQLR